VNSFTEDMLKFEESISFDMNSVDFAIQKPSAQVINDVKAKETKETGRRGLRRKMDFTEQ
jgi:hypothetical protein